MASRSSPAIPSCAILRRSRYHRSSRLQNFPIERDLVVTVGDFVKKIESIYPYIMPKTPRTIEDGEYLQTPRNWPPTSRSATASIACCAMRPVRNSVRTADFIGPGAMALLAAIQQRLARWRPAVSAWTASHGEDGVWSCTAVGKCSDVCPKQVDPANAVNQNKTKSAFDYFLRLLRRTETSA